jgi:hypothetical protein
MVYGGADQAKRKQTLRTPSPDPIVRLWRAMGAKGWDWIDPLGL